MPRTKITPTALSAGVAVDVGAGTTIDATLVTNGAYIDAKGKLDRLVIRVTNTAVAGKDLTFKAAPAETGYPTGGGFAFQAGRGDLVVQAIPANTGDMILSGLEVARHITIEPTSGDRGALLIDFASGHTGKIWAYLLPETVA